MATTTTTVTTCNEHGQLATTTTTTTGPGAAPTASAPSAAAEVHQQVPVPLDDDAAIETGESMRHTDLPDPRILSSTEVGSTRWVGLSTVTYEDRFGKQRKWDVVSRTTKKEESYADAVFILSVVKGGRFLTPHIILVKQWRPAIAKYSIEMPAGLIDAGETPEQAAVRELHEECGISGEAVSCSPELNLSPGISNETGALVHVTIDMNLPENQIPEQKLEDGEDIDVMYIPVNKLVPTLKAFDAKGYSVFMGLYSMAMALNMGVHF